MSRDEPEPCCWRQIQPEIGVWWKNELVEKGSQISVLDRGESGPYSVLLDVKVEMNVDNVWMRGWKKV